MTSSELRMRFFAAVLIVCVASLLSMARLLEHDVWLKWIHPEPDEVTAFETSLAGIEDMKPAHRVMGYVSEPGYDYQFTQYALAPTAVLSSTMPCSLVGRFPSASNAQHFADQHNLILTRTLKQQFFLFRNQDPQCWR
ncbi:MAG: hypothetical protein PHX83_00140 [Acidobacteriia bacterium]|nr:hypothetical protein [Terriglobia bacterium]